MHRLMPGAAGVALGAMLLLAGCGKSSSSRSSAADPAPTDTALSEVAIAVAAGAAGYDDTSANVALHSRPPWQWIADELAFERVAYGAAMFNCGAGTWGVAGVTPSTYPTYTPPNCIITYNNGTTTTLIWTDGPWDLLFTGCAATPVNSGLVGSQCGNGSQVTWSTATPIVRSWTGPLGHFYAVTDDSGSSTPSGYLTQQVAAVGTLIKCVALCPITGDSSTGTRTIDVVGTHITGTLDGNPNWDHTVYTSTSLTINGSGAYRVIESGTLVVEHNLAKMVTTTTFHGPLAHMAGCAFPISGSVTTAISGGSDDGLTETVTFSGTCGQATVTHPDGSQQTLYLSLVL